MASRQTNHFQFLNAQKGGKMTVLNAVMSDFSYAKHAHEELALGVTLGGVQEFSCKGSRFRSFPGNIILFNPGDVHNGNPGNNDVLKYTMLYFDPAEMYQLAASVGLPDKAEFRIPETHFADETLKALILTAPKLISEPSGTSLEYEYCLYNIAKRLAQRTGIFTPGSWRSQKDTLLLKVKEYIHDNISEDISIDDLCRVANISKFHFIRLFRNQFGLPPHQYILNHRINRVRDSLGKGTPPSDIAHAFGFFDVSHLNRLFKRAYGVTPKQYQNQISK